MIDTYVGNDRRRRNRKIIYKEADRYEENRDIDKTKIQEEIDREINR